MTMMQVRGLLTARLCFITSCSLTSFCDLEVSSAIH